MQKFTILLFTLFFALPTYADESIIVGTSTVLVSKIMAEDRPYMVYLPPSYDLSDDNYPVIYLLDGDIHRFKSVVGVLESLSTETLERQVQESIVIAIPNTNRVRDFTPTSLKEWTFKGRVLETFKQTGNAHQFAKFLAQELIPVIENNYRTSEKRVLVGESFGGLFAGNILLESSELFTSYLIIDPTSLWDNDYLNRTLDARTNKFKFDSEVFFAFANNAHLGEIGLTNYQWGKTFASSVIANSDGTAEQRYFETETHGTVAFLAWYHGLKALLPSSEQ